MSEIWQGFGVAMAIFGASFLFLGLVTLISIAIDKHIDKHH